MGQQAAGATVGGVLGAVGAATLAGGVIVFTGGVGAPAVAAGYLGFGGAAATGWGGLAAVTGYCAAAGAGGAAIGIGVGAASSGPDHSPTKQVEIQISVNETKINTLTVQMQNTQNTPPADIASKSIPQRQTGSDMKDLEAK